jgi:hypothetical protein
MLQLLHLNVSKVDQGAAYGMCVGSRRGRGTRRGAGNVMAAWAPMCHCGRLGYPNISGRVIRVMEISTRY